MFQETHHGSPQYGRTGSEHIDHGRDLIVVQSMLHQLTMQMYSDSTPTMQPAIQPSFSFSSTHRPRLQRIVLYQPANLLTICNMPFVAFVSKRQQLLNTEIVKAIHDLDRELVTELARVDGLLAYFSLELRTGQWYNLVLLRSETTKQQISNFSLHTYAMHELAPHYYAWIRLHHGWISGTIADGNPVVQHTNYYTFFPSNRAGDKQVAG